MKYKERPKEEKPREKLKKYGVKALSNGELLAILLRTGNKTESVEDLSNRILKEIGNINKLNDMSINTLTKIKGIGLSKSATIIASIELSKRILKKETRNSRLNNTKKIFEHFRNDFIGETKEHFYILLYDAKLNLIESKELYKGTINSIDISYAEIFKEAIKESATSIVIMHNHPSGDTLPSNEDIELTKNIARLGQQLNIDLLDHIIISPNSYYSFFENRGSLIPREYHKL